MFITKPTDRHMAAMKRLHGQNKHTCQQPGCTTMVMGAYCMKHLESAIANQCSELETGENSPQSPKEEKQ